VLRDDIREELTLNNMIHAFDMQKNLVYNSLLRKNWLSMVLSLIKFFLTRVGCVVDK